jgi:hypothetical protein
MTLLIPLGTFLLGVLVTAGVSYVQAARAGQMHRSELECCRVGAGHLRRTIAQLRAEAVQRRRDAMLEELTSSRPAPMTRPYVIPPAPSIGATSPGPVPEVDGPRDPARIDVGYLEQRERDRIRCAAIREQFSRRVCFDPFCDRCNPGPADRLTGALDLAGLAQ